MALGALDLGECSPAELDELARLGDGLPIGEEADLLLAEQEAAREAERQAVIAEATALAQDMAAAILEGRETAAECWDVIEQRVASDNLAHRIICDHALAALVAGKHLPAYLLQGRLLLEGAGGRERDEATAFGLFLGAARGGSFHAMYRLGACFERGLGVAPDVFQAMHWYEQASEGCCMEGTIALARLYHRRFGGPQRHERLRELHARIMNLHAWMLREHPNGEGLRESAYEMASDYVATFKNWVALP